MKVSVYAIMKDESREQIKGWYESTKEAGEEVLVDTGSTNGSEKYTSNFISVQPFRFDVARNAALALTRADADVCISLDLDERLRPGWRKLLKEAWETRDPSKATRFAITYETPGLMPFLHNSRVHTRSGFYWKDPCHEALYAWGVPEEVIEVPGFVIDHHPDRSKSRSNYLNLLAHGLHEEPWNSRRMFYYARELLSYHHYEKALGWFNKYIEMWSADPNRELNWECEQAIAYGKICEGAIKERDAKLH